MVNPLGATSNTTAMFTVSAAETSKRCSVFSVVCGTHRSCYVVGIEGCLPGDKAARGVKLTGNLQEKKDIFFRCRELNPPIPLSSILQPGCNTD
jgi:hypothetical protein